MGLDGIQYLEIRGPKTVLDTIQESGLFLETDSNELHFIAYNYFGKEHVSICHRTDTYIVISYKFRNKPFLNYLRQALQTYPLCWMKNEYIADDGSCGLWIGRFSNRILKEQILEWTELSLEELEYREDYSDGLNP
jgi:hypothetical protein